MLQENAIQPTTLALLRRLVYMKELSSFSLGGGTNLALRFGHRLSVDLDFFTNEPVNKPELFQLMTKTFPAAELLFEQNQTMLFIVDEVRVDFVQYPFPWLSPFENINGIRLISIKDIIPMKLQAVSNRYSKKDYWDLAFLTRRYSLKDMIDTFKEKFPQIDTGYIIHSLTNFDEAENQPDPDYLIDTSWEDIKKILVQSVKEFTKEAL